MPRKPKPPSGSGYAIVLAPDPLTVSGDIGRATVTTDRPGFLHVESPCVSGFQNVAPGTSELGFSRQCPGEYRFAILDSAEHVLFAITAEVAG